MFKSCEQDKPITYMKKGVLSILVIAIFFGVCAFADPGKKQLTFAFYNVENLFDTEDDPHRNDNEFLPHNSKQWDSLKYHHKLLNISRVLLALNDWEGADVVGLCEVENRKVLEDLLSRTALKDKGYAILHRNSPDPRGIDVALLYKPEKVALAGYKYIPLLKDGHVMRSREILLASFVSKKDTLHFYVNHWSSRRGGQQQSAPKRALAASVLGNSIDSLKTINKDAKIIATGDFNDDPTDHSLQILEEYGMTNVTKLPEQEIGGSLKYRGQWNAFDQMLISQSLKSNCRKYCYVDDSFQVFSPDWLFVDDERYSGKEPFRTFKGKKYLGGYSDHLPVTISIDR